MNLSIVPYTLRLFQGANASVLKNQERKGFLLRMEGKGHIGYSDLCPFPGWGDGDATEILQKLCELSSSHLLSELVSTCPEPASVGNAWHKVNLPEIAKRALIRTMIPFEDHFSDLLKNKTFGDSTLLPAVGPIPIQILWNPNLSVPFESLLKEAQKSVRGPLVVKVKMGMDLVQETRSLLDFINSTSSDLRLRLDFNLSLSKNDFLDWCEEASPWLLSRLDFIEDPFEFDFKDWQDYQSQFGVALAYDLGTRSIQNKNGIGDWTLNIVKSNLFRETEIQKAISVLILKPARQRLFSLLHEHSLQNMKFVLTHYMDHPVGQLLGLAESLQFLNHASSRCQGLGFWPSFPTQIIDSPKQEELSWQTAELCQKLILRSMSVQNEESSKALLTELACTLERMEWQRL